MAKRTSSEMVMVRVTRHGLEPLSHIDGEILDRYPQGTELECSLYAPKSLPQLRLFWSILSAILPSQDRFPTTRDMADALLTECGYYREAVISMDGSVSVLPRSIRDLDKNEFNEFFERAMTKIEEVIIPGLKVEDLIEELRRSRGV